MNRILRTFITPIWNIQEKNCPVFRVKLKKGLRNNFFDNKNNNFSWLGEKYFLLTWKGKIFTLKVTTFLRFFKLIEGHEIENIKLQIVSSKMLDIKAKLYFVHWFERSIFGKNHEMKKVFKTLNQTR